ncbi:MAG: hypothetical protein DWQ31_18120 [Planctomycetota bacterium]|nr:MAG: hypothetical protein DWQ31_18120 [Planctomycetota bacterium]
MFQEWVVAPLMLAEVATALALLVVTPPQVSTDLVWTGLASTGLASTGLASTGLAWTGLAWTGLAWTGLAWMGLAWTGAGLAVATWLMTLLVAMPQHARLARGYDPQIQRNLVRGNWYRTAAWTLRGLLVLTMLGQTLSISGSR